MRILISVLVLICAAGSAWAERRVALVMGADLYDTIRPLNNAVADAIAMKETLEGLDFEVFLETDRDLRRMRRALEDFADDAKGADVALVFFAGHGVEIAGVNRLLPVDTDASTLEALEGTTLPLEEVRETLARIAPIGLILLDACRNDPFGRAVEATTRGAGSLALPSLPYAVKPGLGRIGRSDNVLYAFSAAPGATAEDGNGGNSPFTTALAKYLATDGLEIRSVLTLVQQEVYDRTRGLQLPYVESGLPKTFFASTVREKLPERERLLLAMADVTPGMRNRVQAIADMRGIPLAPLFAVLLSEDMGRLTDAAQQDQLDRAAVRIRELRDETRQLTSSDPEVAGLRAQAAAQLDDGAFGNARELFALAAEIDRQARLKLKQNLVQRTLSEAATHVISGRSALGGFQTAFADQDFAKALALYAEVDTKTLPDQDFGLFIRAVEGAYTAAWQRDLFYKDDSNWTEADQLAMTAHTLLEERALHNPSHATWQRELAKSHRRIAEILRRQRWTKEKIDRSNLTGDETALHDLTYTDDAVAIERMHLEKSVQIFVQLTDNQRLADDFVELYQSYRDLGALNYYSYRSLSLGRRFGLTVRDGVVEMDFTDPPMSQKEVTLLQSARFAWAGAVAVGELLQAQGPGFDGMIADLDSAYSYLAEVADAQGDAEGANEFRAGQERIRQYKAHLPQQ